MNTKEFIAALTNKGWVAQELSSGKVRFESPDGGAYLLIPVDAVKFGTWLNERTILEEPLHSLQ